MALTTLESLKAFIKLSSCSEDARLLQLIEHSDAVIRRYCKRPYFEKRSHTEYLSGKGERDLVLTHRPVWSTPVIEVYLDNGGYFGDGPNAFAESTKLTIGVDYVLKRDSEDGTQSLCGLVRRIRSGPVGSLMGWPDYRREGTLTARRAPTWPEGTGNIKVIYTAGYDPIPFDLQGACNQLAAWIRNSAKRGGMMMTSESLPEYSYSLGQLQQAPELGSCREALSHYREIVL